MTTLDTYGLDIQGVRQAIRMGELCEETTVRTRELPVMQKEPRWARVVLTVGAVLVFVSMVGLGTIGGFLWLSSVGR